MLMMMVLTINMILHWKEWFLWIRGFVVRSKSCSIIINNEHHPQPGKPGFHGQDKVYDDLGDEMLQHAFEGTP